MSIELNEKVQLNNIAIFDNYIEIYLTAVSIKFAYTDRTLDMVNNKKLPDRAKKLAIAEIIKEFIPSLEVEL